MRVVGIDLGARRIGVALSDATGTLASPLEVIERSADQSADHQRLRQLVTDTGAEMVVVGLPLSLDGRAGPAARAAIEEIDGLAGVVGVPVETIDERLSTKSAASALRASGRSSRAQRQVIDKAAAAVILQAWLDTRKASAQQ